MTKNIIEGIYHKFPNFWFANGERRFECATEAQIKSLLKERIRVAGQDDPTRDVIAATVLSICAKQSIDFVYPDLPGYPIGIIPGTRNLVSSALGLLQPQEGDGECDIIESIFWEMLGIKQCTYLYGWLKIICEALRTNSIMPGQVLILAGPQDCGKTLVQTEIITPLLGGKKADPYRFAIGRTDFSGDLCRCAHLMISDQKNPRNREDIREFIREKASNQSCLLHSKNKDASNLDMLQRLSISCNLDEKDLAIIPPLDGIENKVMLFKCASPVRPLPGGSPGARKAFAEAIRAKLPVFLYHILNYPIPEELRDNRFGIKGYINPELAPMVRRLDKEQALLELICDHKRACPEWSPSDLRAGAIHDELFDQMNLRDALRQIAISPDVVGKLLSKLAARGDGVVSVRILDGYSLYTINL